MIPHSSCASVVSGRFDLRMTRTGGSSRECKPKEISRRRVKFRGPELAIETEWKEFDGLRTSRCTVWGRQSIILALHPVPERSMANMTFNTGTSAVRAAGDMHTDADGRCIVVGGQPLGIRAARAANLGAPTTTAGTTTAQMDQSAPA
jgi:hypothetical protein